MQSNSAEPMRRPWEAHVQAARPSPNPLPAAALTRGATSCDTRGEGSPAVLLFNAATRCVHPLDLQIAVSKGIGACGKTGDLTATAIWRSRLQAARLRFQDNAGRSKPHALGCFASLAMTDTA